MDEGPEDSLPYTLNNSLVIISSVLSPCLFSQSIVLTLQTAVAPRPKYCTYSIMVNINTLKGTSPTVLCRAAFMAQRGQRGTVTALSFFVILIVKEAGV